jgi:hypothetical protein
VNKEEKFALEDFGMSEISAGKKTKQRPHLSKEFGTRKCK